jgi:hypothetical protein
MIKSNLPVRETKGEPKKKLSRAARIREASARNNAANN